MATKPKPPEERYADYDMSRRDARQLTDKQEAFVRWYLTPGPTLYNAYQAALKAGYTKASAGSSANRNLKQPPIAAAINRHLKEVYASTELTVESILARLEETRRLALRDKKFGPALKATELQGKYLKMFVDRIEHMHTVEDASTEELINLLKSVVQNVDGLSFDELMESVGGTVDRQPEGDGSRESSGADSAGTASAD